MGDLISKRAAIVALDNRMSSLLENVDMQIAMGFAKGIIHDLPSVTPAEKVGHWYKKPHEICYTCDQCRTTNASGTKYNFCPHCGACMQEVKNG